MQITEDVISVLVYFNEHQRREIKKAGELAGLKVERLINELTAATMAYHINVKEKIRALSFLI